MIEAIVDASAVMAWLWPPQASAASDAFRGRLSEFALEAPFIFDWEVRNLLLRLFGRSPSHAALYGDALAELVALRIDVARPTEAASVAGLAESSGLSLFDAAYLDQALRRAVPLVSRDRGLLAAAAARGAPVYDLL